MKKLDVTTLQTLKTRFDALPHQHKLRPYEVIAELAETISDARHRGYDLDDLVAVLGEAGIRLSRNTVRNYLSRARRDRPAPTQQTLIKPEATNGASAEKASREKSDSASARPDRAAQVMASARVRAQTLRESDGASTQHAPGSFELVPDSEI